MKKRKVIGYDKTIQYLKKGYKIISLPLYKNDFIYDELNKEYITIRYDVLGKLFINNIKLNKTMENYTTYYSLKECELK